MKGNFFLLALSFTLTACVYHDIPFDCSQSDLAVQLQATQAATNCGTADGFITVSVTGGEEPYSLSLNDGAYANQFTFMPLASGRYTVRVRDKVGCEVVLSDVLVMVENFQTIITATPDTECTEGSGALEVDVLENNGPYTYAIDDKPFGESNHFDNLQEGDHVISIKDQSGCTVVMTARVPHGPTGVSWQNDILPIMQASCAKSGCHDGVTRLDWRDYNEVKNHAASIKEKTLDGSMPFDSTLPQEEIDKIACWVNDGTPNN